MDSSTNTDMDGHSYGEEIQRSLKDIGEKLLLKQEAECVKELPKYNGENSTFPEFIEKFNATANAFGMREAACYRILPMCFEGKAKRIFDTIPNNKKATWKDLLDTMANGMETGASRQLQLLKMDDKKGRNESIGDFAERIAKIVKRAYGSSDEVTKDKLRKDLFMKGLPTIVWTQVVRTDPESFAEAVSAAEVEETLLKRSEPQVNERLNPIEQKLDENKERTESVVEKLNHLAVKAQPNGTPGREKKADQRPTQVQQWNRGRGTFRGRPWKPRGVYNGGFRGWNNTVCQCCGNTNPNQGAPHRSNFPQQPWCQGNQFQHQQWNNGQQGQPWNRQQQWNTGQWQNNSAGSSGQTPQHSLNFVADYDSYVNGSSSPKGARVGFLPTLTMMTLALAIIMPTTNAVHTFIRCERNEPSKLLIIPKSVECRDPRDTKYVTTIAHVFNNRTSWETDAFRCIRYRTEVCTSSFLKLFRQVLTVERIANQQFASEIGEEECRKIAESKMVNGTAMIRAGGSRWRTKNETIPKMPHFGGNCQVTELITLQRGTISKGVLGLMSSFGPLTNCNEEQGVCSSNNGTVVWTPRRRNGCAVRSLGSFKAKVAAGVIIVDQLNMAIFPSDGVIGNEAKKCVPDYTLLMEDGYMIHFPLFPKARTTSQVIFEALQRTQRRKRGVSTQWLHLAHSKPDSNWKVLVPGNETFDGRITDGRIREMMKTNKFEWAEPLWIQATHEEGTMSIHEAVLRAIRAHEYRDVMLQRQGPMTRFQIIGVAKTGFDVREAEARIKVQREIDQLETLPFDDGYFLLALDTALYPSHEYEDILNQEFGNKTLVSEESALSKVMELLQEETAKELYSLSLHNFDTDKRNEKMPNWKEIIPPTPNWIVLKKRVWMKLYEGSSTSTTTKKTTTKTTTTRTTTTTTTPTTTTTSPTTSTTSTTTTTTPTTTTTTTTTTPRPTTTTTRTQGKQSATEAQIHRPTTTATTLRETKLFDSPTRLNALPPSLWQTQTAWEWNKAKMTPDGERQLETRPARTTDEEEKLADLKEDYDNLCKQRQERLDILRTIVQANSAMGISVLLQRDDVTAERLGRSDIFAVTQCWKVIPERIIWSRKVDDKCYRDIPIIVDNYTLFADENTREVRGSSYETDCSRITATHVETDEVRDPTFEQREAMKPKMRLVKRNIFDEGFNFTVPDVLVTAWDTTKNTMEEAASIAGKTMKEAGQEMSEKLDTIKKSVGTTLEEVKNDVTETFEKVKERIGNIFRWIVAVLTIIFVVIPLICCCSFCYVKSRATSRASKMLLETAAKMSPKIMRATKKWGVNSVHYEDEEEGEELRSMDSFNSQEEREKRHREDTHTIRKMRSTMLTYVPHVNAVNDSRGELPVIKINLNGQEITALLDSGASISYVRLSTLQQLGVTEVGGPPPTSARVANGGTLDFLATVRLTVGIEKVEATHLFLVSNDECCPEKALLGIDFIRKLNALGVGVEFTNEEILIGGRRVASVDALAILQGVDVVAAETIKLPARSDNVIMGMFKAKLPQGEEWIVEEHPCLTRSLEIKVKVGKSLAISHGTSKAVLVRIMNPTNEEITIWKGKRLAKAQPVALQGHTKDITVYNVQYDDMRGSPEADWEKNLPPMNIEQLMGDVTSDIDFSKVELNEENKKRLRDILNKNRAAFVGADQRIGCFQGQTRHRMDLVDNAKPPIQRQSRVPLELRKEFEKQVKHLLDQGIIRRSTSPFTSPVVLVRKPNGSMRFCVDYRAINKITAPAHYVLPNIQDILDLSAGKCRYSVADFQHGFWQLRMVEEHEDRTAFSCYLGVFAFTRLPMGVKGGPDSFQRAMQEVMRTIKASVFVYIDDLIIASESEEAHLKDIDEVLQRIIQFGMKIRLEKCSWARSRVQFLGHLIGSDGIRPNPEKVRIIKDYPAPTTAAEMKSFLGLISYFRRFIAGFAKTAAPLYSSTTDEDIKWTEEMHKSFEALKGALITEPVLVAPRLGKPFRIETDASSKAIAAVLLQKDDEEKLHAISYDSRVLNKHEARYVALEMEALAITWALQKYRCYIVGSAKCEVITDHSPLTSLLKRKDLTGRLAKYAIAIQEFDCVITYREGRKNVLADALSRYLPRTKAADVFAVVAPTMDNVKKEQLETPWMRDLITHFLTGRPEDPRTTKLAEKHALKEGGILYRRRKHDSDQIVLSEKGKVKKAVMQHMHDDALTGGHLGVEKTHAKIQERFLWNNMRKDIADFIKTCDKCQKRKMTSTGTQKEQLGKFKTARSPFARVHIDLLGPLTQTLRGNKYIMVMVCALTKFVIASAIPNAKSETCAHTFVSDLVAKHGAPEEVYSDRGTSFVADIFKAACKILKIDHVLTAAYHHSGNGQVERWNRTVEEMLTAYTVKTREDWDEHLPLVTMAYNTAKHATTGYTPFYLVHGREARMPIDNLTAWQPSYAEEMSYEERLTRDLVHARRLCRERIEKKTEEQKTRYDNGPNVTRKTFKKGDEVLVKKETAGKLDQQYSGPFKIIRVCRPNVVIKTPSGDDSVHMDRVKKYHRS